MEQLALQTLPFLRTLEGIRNPVFDKLFGLLTYLGDEKIFVVIALILYWCVSKTGGLYTMATGFSSCSVGMASKIFFHVKRPWNIDGYEDIAVDSAVGRAADWSFPSGHTIVSVGTYGAIAVWFRQRWIRIAGIVLAVLIPLTRLYLGVHSPMDILGGALLALVMIFLYLPLFRAGTKQKIRLALCLNLAISLACLAWAYFAGGAVEMRFAEDPQNLANGYKNIWQLIGANAAIWIAWEYDEAFLHFDTKAVWWVQLIKIAGGGLLLLGVQTVIRKICGDNNASYCLANFAAIIAGAMFWPMSFRKLAALGERAKN